MSDDTPAIAAARAAGISFEVARTERPRSAEESASLQGMPPAQAADVKSEEFGPIGRPGWLQL